jgi:hypothetical protein
MYPSGPFYPPDHQGPMMHPVPMEWMQQSVYPPYGMPGPYLMMMPAPYMAPLPGWMPPPIYVDEGNHGPHGVQDQPGPPQASSPPPELIARPPENPTTPSHDSAVAVYAKGSKTSDNAEGGVKREQETIEQQQARKEGFANLLSKALPTSAAPESKTDAGKAGKAVGASRTFNADAAEEASRARWDEIQEKMKSKKPQ